ncbi:hypothetical protein HQ584_12315 [Patescibacteria group bacterium]|nr:hypothetical protein [Patescibacteria group bacterium]
MEIHSDDNFLKVILKHLNHTKIDIDNPEELEDTINEFMLNKLKPIAELLLKNIKQNVKRDIKRMREDQKGFEKRLIKRWREPLLHLEGFIQQCLSEGNDFNKKFREKAAKENDYLFEVLTLLHGRGCQIANEILVLLRSGYSGGAYARWRTLHETVVIAMFIKDHGQALAEKYLHYEIVENYKEALEYQKNCYKLGYEPLSDKEIDIIKKRKNEIALKYGNDFFKNYGWTADILPKKERNFKSIEGKVNMGHMYSWYKLACNNVHSGPKSILFTSSLPKTAQGTVILAGPTNYGLADPGQNCAISLNQVTITLLLSKLNYDRILVSKALLLYIDEICTSFVRIQKQLEKDEMTLKNEN